MGTPAFAAGVLKPLTEKGYNIIGTVTVPDKPAGRGQQIQCSAVKQLAIEKGIPVLQPEKLRDEIFLQQLRRWNADVFVVVAFRMLPEVVWSMPKYGTFNLHASLLPQYRGAAPINRAIINGETETGVTTFFLDHEIDTGRLAFSEKTVIGEEENAGRLHDRLMEMGAPLVCKTLDAIASGTLQTTPQPHLNDLRPAPKIYKETCRINWNNSARDIHNLVRGLSPYPAAFTEMKGANNNLLLKIFSTTPEIVPHNLQPGAIESDRKSYLKVACRDGYIYILDLQLSGKKRLPVKDFLAGFKEFTDMA
ncbi:MAG: methionyl-tRNA formyltransferase [Prevotellaceae bacterium]|jgi:methionyl-tRNA formyltransferase|nr:methionyl-tRNA formyltransferase [Prevotellaceae bacterium]